ncbi:hypothetical protein PWT90_06347 [Aphanocladium album]|nr:hypothetical protein PWT90_06347 [Aphanocladium album]
MRTPNVDNRNCLRMASSMSAAEYRGVPERQTGPSMSPGGDPAVVTGLLPFFERLAAKDSSGHPCTGVIGPGGSGHYVKMIHNGIEQGMMGILSEAWHITGRGLCLSNEEIGSIFEEWVNNGNLQGCFLVEIGAEVMRKTNEQDHHVIAAIRNKVVQDAGESEGTGTWTCKEAISHIMCWQLLLFPHISIDALQPLLPRGNLSATRLGRTALCNHPIRFKSPRKRAFSSFCTPQSALDFLVVLPKASTFFVDRTNKRDGILTTARSSRCGALAASSAPMQY